jgi:hypothetical protein
MLIYYGKPDGRPNYKWEYNTDREMGIKDTECQDVDWTLLTQETQERDLWWALVNTVMDHYVSEEAGNFSTN